MGERGPGYIPKNKESASKKEQGREQGLSTLLESLKAENEKRKRFLDFPFSTRVKGFSLAFSVALHLALVGGKQEKQLTELPAVDGSQIVSMESIIGGLKGGKRDKEGGDSSQNEEKEESEVGMDIMETSEEKTLSEEEIPSSFSDKREPTKEEVEKRRRIKEVNDFFRAYFGQERQRLLEKYKEKLLKNSFTSEEMVAYLKEFAISFNTYYSFSEYRVDGNYKPFGEIKEESKKKFEALMGHIEEQMKGAKEKTTFEGLKMISELLDGIPYTKGNIDSLDIKEGMNCQGKALVALLASKFVNPEGNNIQFDVETVTVVGNSGTSGHVRSVAVLPDGRTAVLESGRLGVEPRGVVKPFGLGFFLGVKKQGSELKIVSVPKQKTSEQEGTEDTNDVLTGFKRGDGRIVDWRGEGESRRGRQEEEGVNKESVKEEKLKKPPRKEKPLTQRQKEHIEVFNFHPKEEVWQKFPAYTDKILEIFKSSSDHKIIKEKIRILSVSIHDKIKDQLAAGEFARLSEKVKNDLIFLSNMDEVFSVLPDLVVSLKRIEDNVAFSQFEKDSKDFLKSVISIAPRFLEKSPRGGSVSAVMLDNVYLTSSGSDEGQYDPDVSYSIQSDNLSNLLIRIDEDNSKHILPKTLRIEGEISAKELGQILKDVPKGGMKLEFMLKEGEVEKTNDLDFSAVDVHYIFDSSSDRWRLSKNFKSLGLDYDYLLSYLDGGEPINAEKLLIWYCPEEERERIKKRMKKDFPKVDIGFN